MSFNVRSDFSFKGTYLDSGATSQKPKVVLDAVNNFYVNSCANVHRGVNSLAQSATDLFESSRGVIANFIGADKSQIIFTRNATEAINLVALSWGVANVKQGDTILLTQMEHHSNLVPWQLLAKKVGAKIEFVPIDVEGRLDLSVAKRLLSKKPKLFAFTHVSNVLGCINPVKELVSEAHKHGVVVLVDAAQSVSRLPIDVKEFDCDFLVFSGHKLYAPFGIGVLFGRKSLLDSMPPVFGGGDMIKSVSFEKSSWNDVPWKFEAGTPNVPGAVGLAAAIDYLEALGFDAIESHERALIQCALEGLDSLGCVEVYGPKERLGVISFNLGDMHAHDVSSVLDERGVCVRSGNHCAQPLMAALKIQSCARMSFGVYTTKEDIDRAIDALRKAKEVFGL